MPRPVSISQISQSASFQRLREITANVFGQVIRTTTERFGYKNLLKGPEVGEYFPNWNNRIAQSMLAWKDHQLEYGKIRLARLRDKGKGPPKKGQGKRAAKKK